jgi:guanylate kinase
MIFTPKIIAVVGTPGSGKDILIRAVEDLGVRHARIVPKHTSRERNPDDGNEMICKGDPDYNLEACDVRYENYETEYGIDCSGIWEGLKKGIFQVIVVSNLNAINQLRERFGHLLILVYVHSEMGADEYQKDETLPGQDSDYVKKRVKGYQIAFNLYLKNYLAFDHVLINSGVPEDLFDQIFRLFRAYERSEL